MLVFALLFASADPAVLSARPAVHPDRALKSGLHPLGLGHGRDGLVYVPAATDRPPGLALVLHGAGGSGQSTLPVILQRFADASNLVVVAPDSRGSTWDAIRGSFGADVAFIDAALRQVFAHVAVDAARLYVAGFSDGASYALAIGLANGDLFRRVLAFSPGFVPRAAHRGRPQVFISHGTHDRVLGIEQCSRRIVPRLREAGYAVRYVEFDGGHEVSAAAAVSAIDWLAEPAS